MITINDLIDQVDLVSPRNQDALRDFIIRELQGIKETLKVARECMRYGRELFIKEMLGDKRYFTTRQAGIILGVSKVQIQKWVADKKLNIGEHKFASHIKLHQLELTLDRLEKVLDTPSRVYDEKALDFL